MNIFDIFNHSPFTVAELTEAVQRVNTAPSQVSRMNLFQSKPISTVVFGLEIKQGAVHLIPISERGEPLESRPTTKRNMHYFETFRIARKDVIKSHELQFVRAFNRTADVVKTLQQEIAERWNGPEGLVADMDATKEHMQLGVLQGLFVDADGSVIYDYFDKFRITKNQPLTFDFPNLSKGNLREQFNKMIHRPMRKKAKGARYSQVRCLCHHSFWDELIKCPEIYDSYVIQQKGDELRNNRFGEKVSFAGIVFEEYMEEDNIDISVNENEAIFFPAGTNNVFRSIWSPGETFDELGKKGKSIYSRIKPDRDNNDKVSLEVLSYPLYMNTRPEMLYTGVLA